MSGNEKYLPYQCLFNDEFTLLIFLVLFKGLLLGRFGNEVRMVRCIVHTFVHPLQSHEE